MKEIPMYCVGEEEVVCVYIVNSDSDQQLQSITGGIDMKLSSVKGNRTK